MNCEEFRAGITGFERDAAFSNALEQHGGDCPESECRALWREEEIVRSAVSQWPYPCPSAHFADRVARAWLATSPAARTPAATLGGTVLVSSRPSRRQKAAAALVTAASLLLVTGLLTGRSTPPADHLVGQNTPPIADDVAEDVPVIDDLSTEEFPLDSFAVADRARGIVTGVVSSVPAFGSFLQGNGAASSGGGGTQATDDLWIEFSGELDAVRESLLEMSRVWNDLRGALPPQSSAG